MSDTENRIRERAHELWEAAGRPHGQSDEFWRTAEREVAEIAEQGGDVAEPAVTTDRLGEATYDKALADSFPASDPPGNTGITGPEDAAAPSFTKETPKTKGKTTKTTGNELSQPIPAAPSRRRKRPSRARRVGRDRSRPYAAATATTRRRPRAEGCAGRLIGLAAALWLGGEAVAVQWAMSIVAWRISAGPMTWRCATRTE